jgi:hypothetical protein
MREPHEFSVGGRCYRAEPMDAISQQHLARRVQPLLVAALPAIMAALPGGKMEPGALLNLDMKAILPAVSSAADLLAGMSDEAFDYIQSKCLSRVRREKAGDTGWVAIWNAQAGRMLFDDIEGHEVQTIVMTVLVAELGPFFRGLVSNFAAASPA